MALPKISSVKYELELPSTGEKVSYRPFLVKEQKTLMLAQESEEVASIQNAIADTIKSCTFDDIDPWTMPSFDLEYLFINIRGKSVGEELELQVTCPDDLSTTVDVKVPLHEIKVDVPDDHKTIIDISDDIAIFMKYPNMKDMSNVQKSSMTETEHLFDMIKTCVDEIHDGEEIYKRIDMTDKELDEFIDSMSTPHLEDINNFFDTMPKLKHVIKVKNPTTNVESEVTLSGFDDFFV